ncbi:hypothetical protein [Nocardioides mangrovi]|uniref:Uncharacterized protein n=1 Tax=Nocardioides mangrovi TaxID=2874580 RepID=A0ABS7U8B7_9ACTN|nr:hypothetical protein [Nocardioides mangrovi]MBZ5737130.1 hypothetical protein [Nocardioides mangrovi]
MHLSAYPRWLALTALAYAVLHHLGLLPDGLGAGPDDTRIADWLDLLVPWLVLVPAALTLRAAPADERTWWIFGAGALAYASGHGIHLAGNSVGNADPGETAHLWDEVVGHTIWYAGVTLVLVALARTMRGRERPGVVGYLLALAVGLTWASNAVGGGTEVLSLLVALAAAAWGWRHRRELGVVLLVGFAPAAVVLVAVGVAALG